MDNNAQINITANASGVAAGVQQAEGSIKGLDATLRALTAGFAELASEMRASMESGAASSAEMAAELKVIQAETEKEAISLREMAAAAHEGLEAVVEMREAVVGFGELLMAAFAVEEVAHLAETIAEAAERTYHLSQQFGLTMAQVQGLGAAAAATGIPLDKLTKAMGILDKNVETKPKLFSDLGIEIPKNASQMQILTSVMEKFKDTADGPNKAAMALTLMGRSGKELIPFLNEGAEGLAELTAKAAEYGAINEDAAAKGIVLAESVNEGKVAMAGLKMTLGDAFAPLLTEVVDGFNGMVKSMTESYNEGGAAKVTFNAITESLEGLGQMLGAVGGGFKELFTSSAGNATDWDSTIKGVIENIVVGFNQLVVDIVTVAKGLKIGFEEMIGYALSWYGATVEFLANMGLWLDKLGTEFQVFAQVASMALNLQWGQIAATWDRGMAVIDAVVRARGAQIVADAKATSDQAKAWLAQAAGEDADLHKYFDKGAKPSEAPKATGIKLRGGGGAEGGDLSTAGKSAPKAPKEKDDLVQKLDAELTAKKMAWAKEQDAQGTAQEYSIQSVADYWSEILKRTDLSAADRAKVEEKFLSARASLKKQEIKIALDGYQAEIEAAGKNYTEKLAIAEKEEAYIGKMYGLESEQYADAQKRIVKLKQDAQAQLRQLEELRAGAIDKASLDAIKADEQLAKHRVEMGAETNTQLLSQERDFENQRYAIERAALLRAQAFTDPSRDPIKFAQISAQIQQLERQHQLALNQIDFQAETLRTARARTAISSISSAWGQAFGKMATLQAGFASTVGSLWRGVQDTIGNALGSIIQKWLTQQMTAFAVKHGLMAADGAASVTSNAAVAGAAAFASTAAIPIVGPALAPAAAASAFAGAMSFAPLASAAGGDWNVRPGLYELHAEEMVLPAWAASPLRSMISGGNAANSNARQAANDGSGDTHNHYEAHFHGPANKREVHEWLKAHASGVAAAVDHGIRNGYKSKTMGG